MPLTPEEKRERERLRKRRQRARQKDPGHLEALPRIGPTAPAGSGTRGGTSDGTPDGTSGGDLPSNLSAAQALIEELTIESAAARYRAALILRLARDLDDPTAVPQRASLTARYTENVDALLAIAKPKERDELDELRRRFYLGETGGIDDDPEAPRRSGTAKG